MRGLLVAGCIIAAAGGLRPAPASAQQELAPADLRAADLQLYWETRLPLPEGETLTDIYRTDEYVYACASGGELFGVLAASGYVRWIQPVTSPQQTIYAPKHDEDHAIVATGTGIAILSRFDGRKIDLVRTQFAVGSPAVSDGKRLYCGGVNHRFYRLRKRDGVMEWQGLLKGPVRASPVIFGETLYVGGGGGRVHALGLSLEWPNPLWGVTSEDEVLGELFVADTEVIFASADRAVYSVNRDRGKINWKRRCDGPLRSGAHVGADAVYVLVGGRGLHSLNRTDGKVRWIQEDAACLLAEGRKVAYARDDTGGMLLLDRTTGRVAERVHLGPLSLSAPEQDHEAVFVGSPDGRLVCLMPASVPYLTAADLGAPTTRPARTTPAELAGLTAAPADEAEGPAKVAAPGESHDILQSKDTSTPVYRPLVK